MVLSHYRAGHRLSVICLTLIPDDHGGFPGVELGKELRMVVEDSQDYTVEELVEMD